MTNLDDLDQIKTLDAANMAGSIELLPEQIQQTWDEVGIISFPDDYRSVKRIVFSGMGGSALGAYVAKYLYTTSLTQSFEIVNDYHLPGYVDAQTLVVAGSYSGTTEETVSGLKEALAKGAKTVAIATGGTLESLAKDAAMPFYKLNPKFNPSNQPRMGIGYSVFALLRILDRLDIISIRDQDIEELKTILKQNNSSFGINTPLAKNRAKKMVTTIYGRVPIFIAGEFLIGAIHAIRNQMNENAKSLAIYFPLPELDHHLLEALKFPAHIQEQDHYIFFHSSLYSPRIAKRSEITRQVVEENGHTTSLFEPRAKIALAQVIESIHFGSYVGYYLALLNDIDPSPIPWVESFKKKLD